MKKKIILASMKTYFTVAFNLLLSIAGITVALILLKMWITGEATASALFGIVICLFITFPSASLTVLFAIVILEALAIKKQRKLHGYSDKFYNYMYEKASKTSNKRKRAKLMLQLAAFLERGRQEEKALQTMSQIDFNALDNIFKAEYFNCYAWIYINNGDTENAAKYLQQGQPYFYRNQKYPISASSVAHTTGVYEYAIGNLAAAENHLINAKDISNNVYTIVQCNLFLALIYLQTNRLELARQLVAECNVSKLDERTKEDLENLRKKIERAFREN